MPKVVMNNIDSVNGGLQTIPVQNFVRVNGQLMVVVGWKGKSHSPCPKPAIHCAGNWSMIEGSSIVFINGIPVCRQGDHASCGHVTTGTPQIFAQ